MPLFEAPALLLDLDAELPIDRESTQDDFPHAWVILGPCDCSSKGKSHGWRARRTPEGPVLDAPGTGASMLIAGSHLWRDYQLSTTVELSPETAMAEVLFRFGDARNHYSLGLWREGLILAKRTDDGLTALDAYALTLEPKRPYRIEIGVAADRILVELDGQTVFSLADTFRQSGAVGLRGNGPASFRALLVSTSREESQRLKLAHRTTRKTVRGARLPRPVQFHSVTAKVDFGLVDFLRGKEDGAMGLLNVHPARDGIARGVARHQPNGAVNWTVGTLDRQPSTDEPVACALFGSNADESSELALVVDDELLLVRLGDGSVKARRSLKGIFAGDSPKGRVHLGAVQDRAGERLVLCHGDAIAVLDSLLEDVFRVEKTTPGFACPASLKPSPLFLAGIRLMSSASDTAAAATDEIEGPQGPIEIAALHRLPGERKDWLLLGAHNGLHAIDPETCQTRSTRPCGHVTLFCGGAFRPSLGPMQFAAATAEGSLLLLDERLHPLQWIETGRLRALAPLNWTAGPSEALVIATHQRPAVALDDLGQELFFIDRPGQRFHQTIVADTTGDGCDDILLVAHDRIEIFGCSESDSQARITHRRRVCLPPVRPTCVLSTPRG